MIQICYALPAQQTLIELEFSAGMTVGAAIAASGICVQYPEIDLAHAVTGIFGKLRSLDTPLADGDRVEIYRPLAVDPKLARQRRVAKTRAAGSAEGRRWTNRESR